MKEMTPSRTPASPTALARLLDALNTQTSKLPKGNPYHIDQNVQVPMRDGVNLLADLYVPAGKIHGTVLIRSPYGRGVLMAAVYAATYAARGYRVVLQSCRGTFGSGPGPFEPMQHEILDGQDTVAWMRDQPWFEGTFATFGVSYLGFTQWALLMDPPKELRTAIVMMGPHDIHQFAHGAGAFRLDLLLTWFDLISQQEKMGLLDTVLDNFKRPARLKPAFARVPLLSAGEHHLGGGALAATYRNFLTRADPKDPFWNPRRLGVALEKVQVPVLLLGGWQDIFLQQTLQQYHRLHQRGVDVALTVGPWTHGGGGEVLARESLDWLAEHLTGASRKRPAPVRVFVTGEGAWHDLADWPPAAHMHTLFLQPGGGLAEQQPEGAAASTFTYDPLDPTPTHGGQLLEHGGVKDCRVLSARKDVLTFTDPVLKEALEVMGVPEVELFHRSDNPHADVFVRLCELDAQGRSRNISDGFCRLSAADRPFMVRLSLDAVAHRFSAGSRIQLLVSGGSHPQYARNLGTGEDPARGQRMRASHRTVHHAAEVASRIHLPVR
ncbi:CocE/NonD family hydrolase [Deinococcus roseus]|uniref:Hydrolase n=1 Tax=Deinococcus roseus TaxID=392414 RepID=A0ABQ2DL09_9DEIO|nr:CocE/NonD family hydrolase [Deinococcus roseus]GGJ59799.1 hydrolase [Deinococcus roseus]